MISTELVEDGGGLARLRADWDALAVACRQPCSAPGMLIPWWRNLAPPDSAPRVVAVRDGDRLVGLAPFLLVPGPMRLASLRLFGTPTMPQRNGILVAEGREGEVVAAMAQALHRSAPTPRIVRLERIDAAARWPGMLAGAWPTRAGAWLHHDFQESAPVLRMPESIEEWLAGKSGNFRGQMRRIRRRLAKRGATISSAADLASASRGIEAFRALHQARWGARSRLWSAQTTRMLHDAAQDMLPEGRMRVWTVEVQGRIVSAQIFFAAGGEVVYWNGGWDRTWSHERPALGAIYAAVEDCFARGDRRIDFGEGPAGYKLRFAGDDDPVAWATLLPRGPAYPLARAATARRRVLWRARRTARSLPDPARDAIRRLRHRMGPPVR